MVIRLEGPTEESLTARILIVDDDDRVRDAVLNHFDALGFRFVKTAASGPDAAVIADDFQPQVVLLDDLMRALKGEDTARLLRKLVPGVKVVALSDALTERPDWADALLPKGELAEAARLIEVLLPVSVETREPPRPGGGASSR